MPPGVVLHAPSVLILPWQVGVLHSPLNYVWLSSLFFLVGGGPTTGTTLITTVVADVVPPELRFVRPFPIFGAIRYV